MQVMPLTFLSVLLTLASCGGESACERYGRIGGAVAAAELGASAEQLRDATDAQAACFAEEAK